VQGVLNSHLLRSIAGSIEGFDGEQLGLLGNTESLSTNCTRAVSSMTVVILIDVAEHSGYPSSTTFELLKTTIIRRQRRITDSVWITYRVLDVDTRVNNVYADTVTSVLIVGVGSGTWLAVGEAGQTPRSVLLRGEDAGLSVLLDIGNLSKANQ
jgi:hypothetical protein